MKTCAHFSTWKWMLHGRFQCLVEFLIHISFLFLQEGITNQWLKTTPAYYFTVSQLCKSDVWVLCWGSHKVEIKILTGLGSYQKAWGEICFQVYSVCWHNPLPCYSRLEFPIFLIAVRCLLSANKGLPHFFSDNPHHIQSCQWCMKSSSCLDFLHCTSMTSMTKLSAFKGLIWSD